MNVKEFILHPTICSLPWIGVFINPDGRISNCAISGAPLGNLNHQTLEQCLHGDVNKQIKQDMINKVAHPRCNACYSVEKFANNIVFSESNRSWYKRYGINSVDMSIYDNPDKFELRVLDLRWRNTCNQACVYCGPDLSSKWAQELNDYRWSVEDSILENEPLRNLAREGELVAFKHDGYWQAMDTFREQQLLEKLILEKKAPWIKWDSI